MIFVGDDWAEAHHDVHVMDHTGARLVSRRLPEGLAGIRGFHELVADLVDEPGEVVIGIETDRGLWVHALVTSGYQVYAVNPMAAARYRDRHSVGGAKSDAGDAKVLADLVRTDRHNHRPIAGDSPDVEGIKVLARAHQNLIWARTRHTNQLRNALREYYPAALGAFDRLADGDTLAILGRAPTPGAGAGLSLSQIRSALKGGGRQRNLDRRAGEIQQVLRTSQLTAPDAVVEAFAATTRATVGIIGELNRQIGELETILEDRFKQHPDAPVPDAERSTTNAEPSVTSTTKPSALSATDLSASSTAVSPTTPSTTKTPPGHTAKPPPRTKRLDKIHPWGVSRRAKRSGRGATLRVASGRDGLTNCAATGRMTS